MDFVEINLFKKKQKTVYITTELSTFMMYSVISGKLKWFAEIHFLQ